MARYRVIAQQPKEEASRQHVWCDMLAWVLVTEREESSVEHVRLDMSKRRVAGYVAFWAKRTCFE